MRKPKEPKKKKNGEKEMEERNRVSLYVTTIGDFVAGNNEKWNARLKLKDAKYITSLLA